MTGIGIIGPTDAKPRRRSRVPAGLRQQIHPTVDDLTWETFERSLKTQDVRNILDYVQCGDLRSQLRMFDSMVDTWPRLLSGIDYITEQVCQAGLKFEPAHLENKKPTDEAVNIANLVQQAWNTMIPDPIHLEDGAAGTVASIVRGYYWSHSVAEMILEKRTLLGRTVVVPRATHALNAQFFNYPQHAVLGEPLRLVLTPEGGGGSGEEKDFPPHQFIVSTRRTHSGNVGASAPLRSLASYWMAHNWGLVWLMQFAQIFGIPLRWATTQDSKDECAVSDMLKQMGHSAWGVFQQGTQINFEDAITSAATLPQSVLNDMANRECDILIKGQTLTTDVADSGSRALGDVHSRVAHGKVCAVIDHVCSVVNGQFVRAILHFNNIPPELAPRLKLPEGSISVQDAKLAAERMDIIVNRLGARLPEQWVHDELGAPVAENDAEVFEGKPEPEPPVSGQPPVPGQPDQPGQSQRENDTVESKMQDPEGANRVIEKLSANVAESVLGVEAKWLAPVVPLFQELFAKAADETVSDEELIAFLEDLNVKLPGLDLDADALQKPLQQALETAFVSGGAAAV